VRGDARRELGSGADAELAVDLREVAGDSVRAEAELRRHVAVPAAGDDELDDLPLGLREMGLRGRAPTDAPQLSARLLQPEARAEPLEDLGCPLEALAGVALVLRPALHRPEREKRARLLEGIASRGGFWLDGRTLKRSDRTFLGAPRGVERPARAMSERAHRCVGAGGMVLEEIEQALGSLRLADADERLDGD
jgi:hypothetical protein